MIRESGNTFAEAFLSFDRYFLHKQNVIYESCLFVRTQKFKIEITEAYVTCLRSLVRCDCSNSIEMIRDYVIMNFI